jgi:hypothetical protein
MIKGGTRQGRVVDVEGRPVAGATVSVVWGTVPVPEMALLTDANGGFRLALPPGRFRLRAHAPDSASGEAEVDGGEEGEMVVEVTKGSAD